MVTLTSIPSLCHIHAESDEDGEGYWIYQWDFIDFLRNNWAEIDKRKIRPDAILREIEGHRNGLKKIDCVCVCVCVCNNNDGPCTSCIINLFC